MSTEIQAALGLGAFTGIVGFIAWMVIVAFVLWFALAYIKNRIKRIQYLRSLSPEDLDAILRYEEVRLRWGIDKEEGEDL